jgi:hypothetical protein
MRSVLSRRLDAYEGEQRAGALALFRIAHPDEPQPVLPKKETAFVAALLERWLDERPDDPLGFGTPAEDPLAALLDGWRGGLVHALAPGPLRILDALAAVDRLDQSQASERLAAMEVVGLTVLLDEEEDCEERLAVSDWLRRAVGPLAAAARLEFKLPPGETAPIAPLDVEAAFQLALPLLELPEELDGSCRLTVRVPGNPPELAGVVVVVEEGEIVSLCTDLRMDSPNFASAAPGAWIDTLVDPSAAAVEYSGDPQFALSLLGGLHEALFGVGVG